MCLQRRKVRFLYTLAKGTEAKFVVCAGRIERLEVVGAEFVVKGADINFR
jgi:hypothetical protein